MNDKSLECIRFYDIQVNKMVKGRGGVILFTDRGCRLFLECSRNDGFYLRDEAVTKAVSDAGFENVDTYVRNQDGELFTVGDDGHRYVMKNWFGGRECDVKSVNDVMEAVRTLARLHVVSSNGVRYLRNNVNTNITKQWECMALAETADEQPESELKASESIVHNAVHFDRGAGLRTNMERHTKEIKKAANYMRGRLRLVRLIHFSGKRMKRAGILIQNVLMSALTGWNRLMSLCMEAIIIIMCFLMLVMAAMQ